MEEKPSKRHQKFHQIWSFLVAAQKYYDRSNKFVVKI